MYTTLYTLDYTAELIELTYELGALTRKYLVPTVVAVYVATIMAYEAIRKRIPVSRDQMIQDCLKAYESILAQDPESKPEEALEALWYFESLNHKDLLTEWGSIK
jgi:hypothetical protein